MNILYDHQIFSLQDVWGISRYYTNLINWLKKDHHIRLPIWISNNVFLEEFADDIWVKVKSFWPKSHWRGKNNLIYWCNKYKTLKKSNLDKMLDGVDIVHLTMFDPYLINVLNQKNIPFVFTVYDLNHKTQSKKYIWLCDYRDGGIEELSTSAKKIITVSNITKKNYIKYYPYIDPANIKVIHHSIDLLKVNNTLKEQKESIISWDYVLYVWDRLSEHKNFCNFVKKISPLLGPNLSLVCLWKEFSQKEIGLFSTLNISNFIRQVSWHSWVKYNLYKYAKCFVYPSVAEWFGIPILEARASWCPVICTDIDIFEEVGWDSVLYVDSQILSDIADKIWSLSQDEVRKKLVSKWYQRVEIFDEKYEIWQTLELYKQVIDEHKSDTKKS